MAAPILTVFPAEPAIAFSLATPLFELFAAVYSRLSFGAQLHLRRLPFDVGDHEIGFAEGTADEVFLECFGVPNESRPAEHRDWHTTVWCVGSLQPGLTV